MLDKQIHSFEKLARLLEKQIPCAPSRFTGTLAAQLSVEAAIRIFRIVDEVLDTVSIDLDCRRDLTYQALHARIEMHACNHRASSLKRFHYRRVLYCFSRGFNHRFISVHQDFLYFSPSTADGNRVERDS